MHAVRYCYSLMHSDVLHHKTHESQLRQSSPSYHSLFSAATWENSVQPHRLWIIPNDSSGSVTQGLCEVSELSTVQITQLTTKGLWFVLCLQLATLFINN